MVIWKTRYTRKSPALRWSVLAQESLIVLDIASQKSPCNHPSGGISMHQRAPTLLFSPVVEQVKNPYFWIVACEADLDANRIKQDVSVSLPLQPQAGGNLPTQEQSE